LSGEYVSKKKGLINVVEIESPKSD